jgi:hypothetical protein
MRSWPSGHKTVIFGQVVIHLTLDFASFVCLLRALQHQESAAWHSSDVGWLRPVMANPLACDAICLLFLGIRLIPASETVDPGFFLVVAP